MKKDLISFDVGLVFDLGGFFIAGETDEPGDIADGLGDIGDSVDVFDSWLPFAATGALLSSFFGSVAEAASNAAEEKGFFSSLALYVGPSINLGPIYLTTGACIGGFGCWAAGGGIRFGSFGIGILIPIGNWW